ncbi:MAG: hypothetical protein LBP95_09125 [Deltaproteobacteria bacterium]|jgi:hypothetical protein|nr:hypothetical protein [Deltaproteobacteria bacterium]
MKHLYKIIGCVVFIFSTYYIFFYTDTSLNFNEQLELDVISPIYMNDQPPLTEEDIKKFIVMLPETAVFLDFPFDHHHLTDEQKNNATIIFKKYNIDRFRYVFIQLKIQCIAFTLDSDNFDYSKLPKSLSQISDTERGIVKKYINEIQESYHSFDLNKEK